MAPDSSLLPVPSSLSDEEWSLRGLPCPSPRSFGGAPLPALGSHCDLPSCVPAGHELDVHSASGRGVGRYAVRSFLCSKGADGAPATLGCFRRSEERWQSFYWELAGLCLAPSWSFHASRHRGHSRSWGGRTRGLWDSEPHLWPFLWLPGAHISCLLGAGRAGLRLALCGAFLVWKPHAGGRWAGEGWVPAAA